MLGYLIKLVGLLIVAGVCGSLAMALAGRRGRKGCILSIAVGFIGALLGTFLSTKVGLPEPLMLGGFPVVWSIAGAAIFVAVLNLLAGRK
jgi:uncharacterized membrane protein YeaQ/YmgE (transglycosylase-associated protein family)